MVLIITSCTMLQASVYSSSGTLSDLIPWIYSLLYLYNHNGFDLGNAWMTYSGFHYFLQFNPEFCHKEFMIRYTVSSRSCFYWLHKGSPFFGCNNIINLILVLTIWWWCVGSFLGLLEMGVCYDSMFSWQNCYSVSCLILYSTVNLACYFKYLLIVYFCILILYDEKNIILGGLVLEGFEGLHRVIQLLQ